MGNASAMISVHSNINIVIKAKLDQILSLKNNPDPILRTVAMAVLPELKHRVHIDGKDSSGGQIGTYSPGYMVLRTGNYQNAKKYVKGAKKGEFVPANKGGDSGRSTKGKSVFEQGGFAIEENLKGRERSYYRRDSDTKVVLSLTRQMENDLSVVATGNGYGIGYLNPDNLKKAKWCEGTYKKKILSKLTTGEVAMAKKTASEFTIEYLKSDFKISPEDYLGTNK